MQNNNSLTFCRYTWHHFCTLYCHILPEELSNIPPKNRILPPPIPPLPSKWRSMQPSVEPNKWSRRLHWHCQVYHIILFSLLRKVFSTVLPMFQKSDYSKWMHNLRWDYWNSVCVYNEINTPLSTSSVPIMKKYLRCNLLAVMWASLVHNCGWR